MWVLAQEHHAQARITAIRAESGFNDAEALARLFEDRGLSDDGSPSRRLQTILAATERRMIRGLQTGVPFLDVGFRGDREPRGSGFRDPWPPSRNQVGHFLTAVGLGFRPALVSEPVAGFPLRFLLGAPGLLSNEQVAKRLIVGHELWPDPGLLHGGLFGALLGGMVAPLTGARGRMIAISVAVGAIVGAVAGMAMQQVLGFRAQLFRATADDEATFDRAVAALGAGTTPDLAAAEVELAPLFRKIDVNSRGNSDQDLRLSLLGWSLGVAIRDGVMVSGSEVASWLRTNLKAS
jgi:hypothetical protein